jgi:hypothetical protein
VNVVKGSDEHGNASSGDREVLRARREFSVAAREAARGEREVELACRVARFQTVAARRLRGVK